MLNKKGPVPIEDSWENLERERAGTIVLPPTPGRRRFHVDRAAAVVTVVRSQMDVGFLAAVRAVDVGPVVILAHLQVDHGLAAVVRRARAFGRVMRFVVAAPVKLLATDPQFTGGIVLTEPAATERLERDFASRWHRSVAVRRKHLRAVCTVIPFAERGRDERGRVDDADCPAMTGAGSDVSVQEGISYSRGRAITVTRTVNWC